ncbi:MAG: SAM-dependent DNA methyltransferase [Gammaproteobacteria bacterium]|nr:SAM-dependent DNA methyltransferase [Gammaproteobacteria bacterium]
MTLTNNTIKAIQDIMRQDVGVDGDAQRIGQLAWLLFLKIFDDSEEEAEQLEQDYKPAIPKRFRWSEWAADPEGETGEELLRFINNEMFPALRELKGFTKTPRTAVVREVFEDAYNYMKSGTLLRQVINKVNEIDFNSSSDRHMLGDLYEKILKDLQSAGNAGEFYTPRAVTRFMAEMIDPQVNEKILDPACGTGGFLVCAIEHMKNKGRIKTTAQERKLKERITGYEKKQLPHLLCVTNMMIHGVPSPERIYHDNTLARPYKDWGQQDRVDVVLTNPPFGGIEEPGVENNFPAEYKTRETADLFLTLIIRLLRDGGRAALVLPDGTLFGEGVKTKIKKRLLEECNLHTIVRLPNSVFAPYTSIKTNLLFFEKGIPTKDIWYYEHRLPEGVKAYNKTKPMRVEEFETCKEWWGGENRKGRKETEVAWKVSVNDIKANNFNLDIKNPNVVEDDHGDPDELLASYKKLLGEINQSENLLKDELASALASTNK